MEEDLLQHSFVFADIGKHHIYLVDPFDERFVKSQSNAFPARLFTGSILDPHQAGSGHYRPMFSVEFPYRYTKLLGSKVSGLLDRPALRGRFEIAVSVLWDVLGRVVFVRKECPCQTIPDSGALRIAAVIPSRVEQVSISDIGNPTTT